MLPEQLVLLLPLTSAIYGLGIAFVIFCVLFILTKALSRKPLSFWKIYKYTFLSLFIVLLAMTFLIYISGIANPSDPTLEAASIISDLRYLKAAVVMYYADNKEKLALMKNHVRLIASYVDYPEKYTSGMFAFQAGLHHWWVGFNLKGAHHMIKSALFRRARSVGLYGSPRIEMPPLSPHESNIYKESDGAVWLVIEVANS